jgi:hypothetical protein
MRAKIILALEIIISVFIFIQVGFTAVPNQITYTGSLRSYVQPVSGNMAVTFNIYLLQLAALRLGPADRLLSRCQAGRLRII